MGGHSDDQHARQDDGENPCQRSDAALSTRVVEHVRPFDASSASGPGVAFVAVAAVASKARLRARAWECQRRINATDDEARQRYRCIKLAAASHAEGTCTGNQINNCGTRLAASANCHQSGKNERIVHFEHACSQKGHWPIGRQRRWKRIS